VSRSATIPEVRYSSILHSATTATLRPGQEGAPVLGVPASSEQPPNLNMHTDLVVNVPQQRQQSSNADRDRLYSAERPLTPSPHLTFSRLEKTGANLPIPDAIQSNIERNESRRRTELTKPQFEQSVPLRGNAEFVTFSTEFPPGRWAELPDAPPTSSHDGEQSLRTILRCLKLNLEQAGMVWSE